MENVNSKWLAFLIGLGTASFLGGIFLLVQKEYYSGVSSVMVGLWLLVTNLNVAKSK